MLELTPDECAALEKTVTQKICAALPADESTSKLYSVVTQGPSHHCYHQGI